ncbi:hypothetical protein AVEN_152451-1 [Araneus ventricosus]|uniref:Uncharacterized protein n=1 Tax=Araneus ventricosus TaxID=182803 RepID=A0A4Y2TWC4_ARAVE|nr:hypothetical protein AVEN_152451-1 [Araneus ventricosus]
MRVPRIKSCAEQMKQSPLTLMVEKTRFPGPFLFFILPLCSAKRARDQTKRDLTTHMQEIKTRLARKAAVADFVNMGPQAKIALMSPPSPNVEKTAVVLAQRCKDVSTSFSAYSPLCSASAQDLLKVTTHMQEIKRTRLAREGNSGGFCQ